MTHNNQTSMIKGILFATAVMGLSLAGCDKNPPSAKSSSGKEIKTVSGSNAATQPGVQIPVVNAGPAKGKRDPRLEVVSIFNGPGMPVGIALSKEGRTFMSFPRWLDPVLSTLVELKDGKVVSFPDDTTNAFDGTKLDEYKPADHLISVQAVVFDDKDHLWALDPACFNFGPSLNRGPKLWCYDINSRQLLKKIIFPNDVAMKMTALNDVRFDLHRGSEGTAYITDSGVGGIIVVDLASGDSWRHLDHDPSVMPTIGLNQTTEGQPFVQIKPNGEQDAPDFKSDGIALSPDGKTLYYMSVVSHDVYAVPTDLLADRNADEQKISSSVKKIATKPSGNDGIWCDGTGLIYTADFEDNAIRQIDPKTGEVQVLVQDERLIWPDTLSEHDGYLYVTSNQLARQANYHKGTDQREATYVLFRIRLSNQSTAMR